MRLSRVLAKLRNGGVVSCTKVNLLDSRVVEIAAMAGFDCIWTDMEHVPNDWSAVEKQILAAKAYDTDVLVRVARGGYSDYIRPFEMDATGIMVPHIMSLEDAKNVVRMTRFHPIGRRPIDGGNADGAYCAIDLKDYIQQSNNERFIIVQIEDPEPLDELEEIAALDGIDMLFFGPGDFSHGIGAPGEWDHPMLDSTRKRIAEVAIAHNKFAGTVGSIDNMDSLIDIGYRFISIGADVISLTSYFRDIVSGFNKITFTK
ncbi:MAG TPA: aldolase [Clostridiaceae bacterium]|jgi:4-hydroxy-2-oxoheptanedioate aldolase|nr:aldolase [Clostridiaceae bacterium]